MKVNKKRQKQASLYIDRSKQVTPRPKSQITSERDYHQTPNDIVRKERSDNDVFNTTDMQIKRTTQKREGRSQEKVVDLQKVQQQVIINEEQSDEAFESEDLQSGQLSPASDLIVSQPQVNHVRMRTVDLGYPQPQPSYQQQQSTGQKTFKLDMTGEMESMYTTNSQRNKSVMYDQNNKIKMSISDGMIFETQQLQKANWLIMNQPDRRIHDYSQPILQDKNFAMRTASAQKGKCGKDCVPSSQVEDDSGLDLNPLTDKSNPLDTIWCGIRKWREKNVQYAKLEVLPYELTREDLEREIFGDSLLKGLKFEHREIDNSSMSAIKSNINIQVHYEEVFDTGEKFLRIATRQWTDGFDPKSLYPLKECTQYEIQTLRCYRYVQSTQEDFLVNEFDLQHHSIYDVTKSRLSIEDGAFNNDFFLPYRNHTFFFQRVEHGFQLVRQSMMEPQSLPGPTEHKESEATSNVHTFKNFFIPIEEPELYQICFIKPASKGHSLSKDQSKTQLQFLLEQFVMVKEKRFMTKQIRDVGRLRIFALRDLDAAIFDETKKLDFNKVQAAFWISKFSMCAHHKGEDDTIIILRCNDREHQIVFSHINDIDERDYAIKTLKREAYIYYRHLTHQIKIVHKKIDMNDGTEPYDQTYAVSIVDSNYMPFPIYPLHQEQDKGKIGYNACQFIQNKFRENHAGSVSGPIIFDENNHFSSVTQSHKDNMFYELKDKENQNYDTLDQYIATSSTFLKVNVFQGIIHCWFTFRDHSFSNFHDKIIDLEQQPIGQNFKTRLYKQFARDSNHNYQNNYNSGNFAVSEYSPNMNLQPMYIHQSKQNVMSYHNKLFVNENCYEFHEKYLLIDLNQKGGKFIKIQLFDNETKDCRLVKYHSDPKSQKVILFFLQRNLLCQNDKNKFLNMQSGVYFFTVTTFARLNQLANNHNLQSYLLSKETTIQVMVKIDKFIKMKYDREKLTKYQGKGKIEEKTLNHIAFEMVHDMLNPVKNWVPFIFSNLDADDIDSYYDKKDSLEESQFSTYLCFMNLEKYKLLYEEQDDQMDQNDPNDFIQKYYLQQYVNAQDHSKQIKTLHRYNQSNKELSLSMFTRCSNWQEDLYKPNSGQFSARYQVGLSNRKEDVQVIEIQEFIVTIKDDTMNLEPMALRHILASRELYQYCQLNKEKINLHRLIPELDDNGSFYGSSMMFCLQVYSSYKQVNPAIKNSMQDECTSEQKAIHELSLSKDKYKTGHLFGTELRYQEFIENRFGAKCQVLGETIQSVEVQFEDNERKNIPKAMIQEFQEGLYIFDNQQYEYGIIPFYGDQDIQLKTPLLQMGYRKYVPMNRTNEFLLVHTSRMNSHLLQAQTFSQIELLFELYRSQKINLTMSFPNFEELMTLSITQRQKVYFQHRYIFNGRNYCGIDLPHYKSNIDVLKGALSDNCLTLSLHQVIPNSSFKFQSGFKDEGYVECDKRVDALFSMFDGDRLHAFQLNLNHESFLQKSLDNNYARALYFLLNYILEKKNDIIFQEVMMAELPQLICQDRVPILEFFSALDQEDGNKDFKVGVKNVHEKDQPCNIETRLKSSELPFLGTDEQIFSVFTSFQNIYNIQKEIEKEVISDAEELKTKLENEATEQELIDIEEKQCEIQHDYINFQPLIRKIKIDKMMGRQPNKFKGTHYLGKFDDDPKLINSISDLFLADILQQRQDAPEFYLQKSVQKLIDRQYHVTKDVMFHLLVIYCIGFVVPFAINIYYQGNFWIQVLLTGSGIGTQVFFLVLEYPEFMYRGGSDYLKDPWNYIDSTQIIFYTGRVILNMFVTLEEHNLVKLFRNLSTIICLLQSMLKLLQLIKYKEEYCFLVQMITQVFKDLSAFMTIFMLNVYIFAMVYFVMGVKFESPEYDDMLTTFSGFIQVFRNSIGDIIPVELESWAIERTNDPMLTIVATGIVWAFWFINIFTMTIVFLNFVIAEVSNTYTEVKESGTLFLYQKKAEMNFFAQNINFFFGQQTRFVALVFTTPKGMSNAEGDSELLSFSTKLKADIQIILGGHQKEALRSQMKYDQNLKDLDSKIDCITKSFAMLQGSA